MNKVLAAKTLLTSLSQFERIMAENRCKVNNHAIRSFSHPNSCNIFFDKMVNEIYKNKQLEELKSKLATMLERTSEKERKLLKLRFVHKLPTARVAEILGQSRRTIFRNTKKAIENFSERLQHYDLNDQTYAQILREQSWIDIVQKEVASSRK